MPGMSLIENFGLIFSLLFIILNAKGRIAGWLFGILGSGLYIYVFYNAELYSAMGLQVYYVVMGVYGWISWKSSEKEMVDFYARSMSKRLMSALMLSGAVLSVGLGFIMKTYLDSSLPFQDAFTTVYAFIATWMMAKRYYQNWTIWIIVDASATVIYIYKELYPTALLFGIYTIMAFYGYYNWKNLLEEGK